MIKPPNELLYLKYYLIFAQIIANTISYGYIDFYYKLPA